MEVSLTALYPEIRMLTSPAYLDSFSTSNTIEDTTSNTPLAVAVAVAVAVANLKRILAIWQQVNKQCFST